MQNNNESLFDVFVLLYKKRKRILFTTLGISILAAIASLFLPNYYQASTQFYAANPQLGEPIPLGNQPDSKYYFGDDYAIDRLLSISRSNEVFNFLADSFDLYKHYEIDPTSAKAKHKMRLKLDKLYNSTKTKYDAIQLSIEDKDPEKAAIMANAVRAKVDALAQRITKETQGKLLKSYSYNVERKRKIYMKISDSLYMTRSKYDIFNTQSQGEAYGASMVELQGQIQNYRARINSLRGKPEVPPDSILIMQAKLTGAEKQFEKLNKNIEKYNAGYQDILKYERQLRDFGDQLNMDEERMKQLKSAYDSEISMIHIIEKAETPVYKSRPRRSILVIGVGIITFALLSLWTIIQQQLEKLNWREKVKNA